MAIDPDIATRAIEHSVLYTRFATALDLMEAKLVKLVAGLPMLLVRSSSCCSPPGSAASWRGACAC